MSQKTSQRCGVDAREVIPTDKKCQTVKCASLRVVLGRWKPDFQWGLFGPTLPEFVTEVFEHAPNPRKHFVVAKNDGKGNERFQYLLGLLDIAHTGQNQGALHLKRNRMMEAHTALFKNVGCHRQVTGHPFPVRIKERH